MVLALAFALLVKGPTIEPPPMVEPAFTPPPAVEPAVALPAAIRFPSLLVMKSKRELQLLSEGEVIRTYRVGLGLEPVLPKVRQGDYATPEGRYYVCMKNPQSKYTVSLGLSYPGPADARGAVVDGMITVDEYARILAAWEARSTPPWNTPLGGEIMIHGRGSQADWTWGCVALDDTDIQELYRVIPVGTPVEILP